MITKGERYREILGVLARHGIGVVDDQFVKHEAGDRARAEHLRRACEELGTMFIKLGQALSTRGDLLPDAYAIELSKLQDEVTPLPAPAIVDVIREDLGAPPDQLFAFFDPQPLGSASIGQVHAARLFDGRQVVLKVRKPGVNDLVPIDLTILAGLIDEWSPRLAVLEQYDARALVREFSDALRAELDYDREAANDKFFRDLFQKELGFAVPEVIAEYTKNRVLTEERVEGHKATEVAHLPKRQWAVAARRIARFMLEPAFKHGVFYADPPPRQSPGPGRRLACHHRFRQGGLSIELPRRIDRVLGEVERGNLRVWTRIEDVEPLIKRVEHLVARSNATILAAACIVGPAIVMLFYRPHGWEGWIGGVFWIAVGAALIDYVRTLLTLRK